MDGRLVDGPDGSQVAHQRHDVAPGRTIGRLDVGQAVETRLRLLSPARRTTEPKPKRHGDMLRLPESAVKPRN